MKPLFYTLIFSWLLPFSLGNTAEIDRNARFLPAINAFEKWDKENSFPSEATLLVGSSSINFWESAAAFPHLRIINRGFGGSITPDILFFYDRVIAKYQPRTVVIYVGGNDIAHGFTVQETVENLKTLIGKIATDFPAVKVVYLPISPNLRRWKMWPDMKQVNQKIASYAHKSKHVYYVDTATPLLADDGTPDIKYFADDGLHLNEAGYVLWNILLEPHLR